MNWHFEKDRPIYAQLIEQIQLGIISGEYKAGEKLPSVRDLASEAAVNPNTMQRALTELERDGLVHTQRTSGRFITEDEALIELTKERLAVTQIDSLFRNMQAIGYNQNQTISLIKQHAGAKEEQ